MKSPVTPNSFVLPSRRAFLAAAVGGVSLAGLERSGLASLLGPDGRGNLWSEGCLRPPGALPEARRFHHEAAQALRQAFDL